jgi:hypothetical protein
MQFTFSLKIIFMSRIKGVRINWLFLSSLLRVRSSNNIIIFHTEPWYFLTDLPNRLKLYKEILGSDKVLFVNLANVWHLRILEIILRDAKKKINCFDQSVVCNKELLKRCIGDVELNLIRSDTVVSRHSDEYLDNVNKRIERKINIQKPLYIKVQSIFGSPRVSSLAIVQNAYIEKWYSSIATKTYGMSLIEPESQYGYKVTKPNQECTDLGLENQLQKKLSNEDLIKAKCSLENRINGNFAGTSIGFYMYDSEISENQPETFSLHTSDVFKVILFMHCFSDSPNIAINSLSDFHYIDHYHYILKMIESIKDFANVELFLKPHPSSFSHRFIAKESIFIKSLQQMIRQSDRIHILSHRLSLRAVSQLFNETFIAVTGCGSVTVECAYLGIPIVNYINNIYTKLGISKLSLHPSHFLSELENISTPCHNAKKAAIAYEASRTKSYQYMLYDHSKRPPASNMAQLCEIKSLLR